MTKNRQIFDIETFPNFFSVVLLDAHTTTPLEEISKLHGLAHRDVRVFTYAPQMGYDDLDELADFLSDPTIELVGFNNIAFDTPTMYYTLDRRPSNKEIFNFAQRIISENSFGSSKENYYWSEIDLMKAQAYDSLGVSLKQCSINLRWWRVQDLPFPYDHHVSRDEVDTILDYNLNDVLISTLLYKSLHKELGLREELSKSYGINLLSASDSRMANLMLNDIYTRETGIELFEIQYLRTKRELVWLRECVRKGISFRTEKLRDLKYKIDNTVVVSESNFAFKERITFGNCAFDIGVGGLHSVDNPCIFETDDDYTVRDADVASFYPNIIIQNGIKPKHLGDDFVRILDKITQERVAAKKTDKTKADGLKITINSIFGKLNSEYFWLEDAKAMLSVTLSGQLYLLMLIEDLMLRGIMTISANTDGIVCRIPRELEDVYYATCREWEEKTGFELEYSDYARYIRADVNNYITQKPDGSTKEKGRFVREIGLKKGYRHPIIPRAIYEYFVNGVPVMETLLRCDNILDFCISQKSGSKFAMELHEDNDITPLQKNNRFYISCEGGKLIKRNKRTDSLSGLYVSEEVVILNDYDSSVSMEEYDVDYDFYEEEASKYIRDIESGVFDFSFILEELDENPERELIPINHKAEIVPAKFRYSAGAYRYDEESRKIYRGVASINYLSDDTGEALWAIRNNSYESFLDFLIRNDANLNSRQIKLLITLGFFSEFGGRNKLLVFYDEFKKGKFRYNKNHKDKTKLIRVENLNRIWGDTPDSDFTIRQIMQTEISILGTVQTRFKNLPPKIALVEGVDTTFSPKIDLYSLANGTRVRVKINKKNFKRSSFETGYIIDAGSFKKEPRWRKTDDGFEEVPDAFDWWMTSYKILFGELENHI